MRCVNLGGRNSGLVQRIFTLQNNGIERRAYYKEGITSKSENSYTYVKPFTYHGFNFSEETVKGILNSSLKPTFSYKFGSAIYSKLNSHKTIGFYYNHDALISIYHNMKHLEKYKTINPTKKDWILFTRNLTPKSFLYIARFEFGGSINNKIEIEKEKEYKVKNVIVPLYIVKTPGLESFDLWKNRLEIELGNLSAKRIKELNKPLYKVPVKITEPKIIDYKV